MRSSSFLFRRAFSLISTPSSSYSSSYSSSLCSSNGVFMRSGSVPLPFTYTRTRFYTTEQANNPLAAPTGETEVSEKVKNLVEEIVKLNLVETASFAKALQARLGISDAALYGSFGGGGGGAAPAAAAPAAQQAAPAAAEPPKEEKKAFDLKLVKLDEGQKIKLLKEIRTLRPNMQLTESKALIEKLPSILKDKLPLDEAKKWQEKLKTVGAEVELV